MESKDIDKVIVGERGILGRKRLEPWTHSGTPKKRTSIKGERIRTLAGISHSGTNTFESRVSKRRKKNKAARKARRKNRGK